MDPRGGTLPPRTQGASSNLPAKAVVQPQRRLLEGRRLGLRSPTRNRWGRARHLCEHRHGSDTDGRLTLLRLLLGADEVHREFYSLPACLKLPIAGTQGRFRRLSPSRFPAAGVCLASHSIGGREWEPLGAPAKKPLAGGGCRQHQSVSALRRRKLHSHRQLPRPCWHGDRDRWHAQCGERCVTARISARL